MRLTKTPAVIGLTLGALLLATVSGCGHLDGSWQCRRTLDHQLGRCSCFLNQRWSEVGPWDAQPDSYWYGAFRDEPDC